MNIKVHTILTLKKVIGQAEMEVSFPEGSTVAAVLHWMAEKWGEKLSSLLFEPEGGELLPRIRLMVNGRDMGFLDGMSTVLRDGDELLIMPPVAGG